MIFNTKTEIEESDKEEDKLRRDIQAMKADIKV